MNISKQTKIFSCIFLQDIKRQPYIPFINSFLLTACLVTVFLFLNSSHMKAAYGLDTSVVKVYGLDTSNAATEKMPLIVKRTAGKQHLLPFRPETKPSGTEPPVKNEGSEKLSGGF